MNLKPGEVWLADLGLTAKTRPVVIVSREDANPPRVLVIYIYIPLTTQNRGSDYEVDLGKPPFLQEASAANVQGIGSVPVSRLQRKLGLLPAELLEKVKRAIAFAMEL